MSDAGLFPDRPRYLTERALVLRSDLQRTHKVKTSLPAISDATLAASLLNITPKHLRLYGHALARWATAGFPERTPEEIAAIHAVCRKCPHRLPGGVLPDWVAGLLGQVQPLRCKICGCGVQLDGPAVLNKARMATEDCPRGKWPNSRVCERRVRG
jgi:hypothetical protein